MRSLPVAALVCLVIGAFGAGGALAITYGVPDGDAHPSGGALLFSVDLVDPTYGPYTLRFPYCSGTLIAPNLFLTAAHCVEGIEDDLPYLSVSFDTLVTQLEAPGYTDPRDPVPNNPRVQITGVYRHPDYTPNREGRNAAHADLAVLVLDPNTATGPMPGPAALPPAGIFDRLQDEHAIRGLTLTAVGYGTQVQFGGGRVQFPDSQERRQAVSEYRSLGPGYITLSQNPATGDGGTCYGDSGGPNYLTLDDGSEVVAAVTVTGDDACRSTNVDYRLDNDEARSFLATVPGLTLP